MEGNQSSFTETAGLIQFLIIAFQAPVPATPWDGLFKADSHSYMCLQFDAMVRGAVMGKEDCLYLNIYTPDVSFVSSFY